MLNPTNHSYFNLKGAGNGDVLNHRLQVFSDAVTPTDANHMATGEVMKVSGTGFDFTRPKAHRQGHQRARSGHRGHAGL